MTRITIKQLEQLAQYLNELTNSPLTYRNESIADSFKANIGHWHISQAYGGACMHRTVSDGGGVTCPIVHGHVSKRELFDLTHAFIKGLTFTKYEA